MIAPILRLFCRAPRTVADTGPVPTTLLPQPGDVVEPHEQQQRLPFEHCHL